MYLKEVLKSYGNKKIEIYIDMDGVIADYNVGEAYHYDKKRPLYASISKIKEISTMNNVTLNILSITRKNIGIEEKNIWLDKYVPFIAKKNRFIISKEENTGKSSSKLKVEFLNKIKKHEKIIILIDDDPLILKEVMKSNNDIVLLKDTALVD